MGVRTGMWGPGHEHHPVAGIDASAQATGGDQTAGAASEDGAGPISHGSLLPAQKAMTLSAQTVHSARSSRLERWAPLVSQSSWMPRASRQVPQQATSPPWRATETIIRSGW